MSGTPFPSSLFITEEGFMRSVPPVWDHCLEIPRVLRYVGVLSHGEAVCAVALSDPTRFIYTGSKGILKIWDLTSPLSAAPLVQLDCFPSEGKKYIRSLKFVPDGKTLIAAGQASVVSVWDHAGYVPILKGELKVTASGCYDVAVSPDSKMCFRCCIDGNIAVWDLHNRQLVRKLQGHDRCASCVDISSDGTKLWTAGLDKTIRIWDMTQSKALERRQLTSLIYSARYCPTDEWLGVGLENSLVELLHATSGDRYRIRHHTDSVLSVRFARCGKWFVSAGKDGLLSGYTAPYGNILFYHRQASAIFSSEISADDRFIVTGSANQKATIYEAIY